MTACTGVMIYEQDITKVKKGRKPIKVEDVENKEEEHDEATIDKRGRKNSTALDT